MRKRIISAFFLLILIAAGVLWQVGKSRTFQFFGVIVPRVRTNEKVVALTFDDGPTTNGTREILNVLEERHIKATFFLIGGELQTNLDDARKIIDAGHEVGNHSFSHTRMLLVSPSFVKNEIEKTDALLREAGYKGDIHFRPPYGKKLFTLPWYLSRNARKTITWDVEPDSNAKADSNAIVEETRKSVQPGSIILLHAMYPNRKASLNAVKGIIEVLQQQGYRFVTVSEIIALRA